LSVAPNPLHLIFLIGAMAQHDNDKGKAGYVFMGVGGSYTERTCLLYLTLGIYYLIGKTLSSYPQNTSSKRQKANA